MEKTPIHFLQYFQHGVCVALGFPQVTAEGPHAPACGEGGPLCTSLSGAINLVPLGTAFSRESITQQGCAVTTGPQGLPGGWGRSDAGNRVWEGCAPRCADTAGRPWPGHCPSSGLNFLIRSMKGSVRLTSEAPAGAHVLLS